MPNNFKGNKCLCLYGACVLDIAKYCYLKVQDCLSLSSLVQLPHYFGIGNFAFKVSSINFYFVICYFHSFRKASFDTRVDKVLEWLEMEASSRYCFTWSLSIPCYGKYAPKWVDNLILGGLSSQTG